MLMGNLQPCVGQSIKNWLLYSDYKFYLTGSQYFDPGNPDNKDWDFFTEAFCPAFKKSLKEFGFIQLQFTSYSDHHTKEVWRQPLKNIDIQIVKDALLKDRLQRYAVSNVYICNLLRNMNKTERWLFWDYLYSTFSNVPEYITRLQGTRRQPDVNKLLENFDP